MVATGESWALADFEGYSIEARLARGADDDGRASHFCTLTATQRGDLVQPFRFARTIVFSEAQAALTNPWQPGALPPLEQLNERLVAGGATYLEGLICCVNRGQVTIAQDKTLSLSEARSRIGMSDAALATREA